MTKPKKPWWRWDPKDTYLLLVGIFLPRFYPSGEGLALPWDLQHYYTVILQRTRKIHKKIKNDNGPIFESPKIVKRFFWHKKKNLIFTRVLKIFKPIGEHLELPVRSEDNFETIFFVKPRDEELFIHIKKVKQNFKKTWRIRYNRNNYDVSLRYVPVPVPTYQDQ